MRIAVLGAGGVGGYFGGRLAAGGADVTLVARGAHLEAIRARGLRILSPLGDLTIERIKTVDHVARLGPVDLVIVAVKLWDTEAIAPSLAPLAEQGAVVVSFQNGVEKDAVLARHLPAGSLIGGVSYIAATIAEPGVIRHVGAIQRLIFGEHDGRRSARVEAFLHACRAGAIEAEISEAIDRLIWEKFVFLVGLSGTTTAMRRPIGPIRDNPQTRRFLRDLMREVVAVGRARGVPLAPGYAESCLAFCDTLPADTTASMARDLERGNRLEVAWLSGGVAALAAPLGIETPLNRAVFDLLALHAGG